MVEADAGIGLFIGITCGLCCGWVLRGKFRPLNFKNLDLRDKTFFSAGKYAGHYKMVLVVRQDLGMGKGKIAAQCSHAAVGLYRQLTKNSNLQVIRHWENSACPKVVVKAPDEDALKELANKANDNGIETCLVQDAGRTQIAPGSRTVLGIGPGPVELMDKITGHLKLC